VSQLFTGARRTEGEEGSKLLTVAMQTEALQKYAEKYKEGLEKVDKDWYKFETARVLLEEAEVIFFFTSETPNFLKYKILLEGTEVTFFNWRITPEFLKIGLFVHFYDP
jgi:hypothetical protein